jgi:hypothetical protein
MLNKSVRVKSLMCRTSGNLILRRLVPATRSGTEGAKMSLATANAVV